MMSTAGKALLDGTLYKSAVVGAGPAGLALVATLLDCGRTPILWVDPKFNSGRLERYGEVPSNTKTKLFTQYVLVSPSLSRISATALAPFKDMDPEKGCDLGYAARMVVELTNAIRSEYKDKVHFHTGMIDRMAREEGGTWRLDNIARSQEVYLATGSHPKASPPDASYTAATADGKALRVIDLDDMLTPSKIPSLVSTEEVVAVVGSSHSAVLVLRNLLELGDKGPKKVINLYRSPLLYAKVMDGWILYDNTGLKGLAADWAREKLETKVFEESGKLERVCVKDDSSAVNEALSQCTAVVYAVGYESNTPPTIVAEDGQPLPKVKHDVYTGKIAGAEGVRGFGIAFPERVTDPHGNVETSVGLWKFVRHIRAQLAPPQAQQPPLQMPSQPSAPSQPQPQPELQLVAA